jgi:hypothetical protein
MSCERAARGGCERVGRDASPSAAIIDSQSVKTTEAGGARGYDAGKKVNGRKRHALVDTDGRGLVLEPHPASVQDRDGGGALLSLSRRLFPFIERVFADSGSAGEKVAKATLIAVEIVRKNPDQVGFAVNPRRWVVGVSSEGHAVMSVKVRPELKDSGFEAREAPWRESKTAEPSDNMLERSMREASGCNVQ